MLVFFLMKYRIRRARFRRTDKKKVKHLNLKDFFGVELGLDNFIFQVVSFLIRLILTGLKKMKRMGEKIFDKTHLEPVLSCLSDLRWPFGHFSMTKISIWLLTWKNK